MRLFVVICLSLAAATLVHAQQDYDKDPLSWDRQISAKFVAHCYKCHGSDDPTANVDLASDENPRLIVQHRDQWELVLESLKNESMPPEDAKRKLSDEDRDLMVRFLERTLNDVDCDSASDPGRPVLRRLNRTEYDNAVLDLTGLDLRLGQDFPAETQAYGFDNVGDALTLTPLQVQQYHDAAQTIVAGIIATRGEAADTPYKRTFIVSPSAELQPREAARQIVTRFARVAFRRDAAPAFIESLVAAYDRARREGADHDTAAGYLITGILVSPRFLMRVEADQPATNEPYPVDDFELATRLSFFLWSRPPDERLSELAGSGQLDEALDEQALRMLADDRSRAMVENFFFQWLGINELESFQPDPNAFAEFDESLRHSMRREAFESLRFIVRENRPITEIIHADHLFLDERLASHYDLTPEFERSDSEFHNADDAFRKVAITDGRRGGLLTSAALLMLQADPTRTNIPRRGNFIAGRILGAPPPPPPPEVPPLGAASDDRKSMTLRERLALHRSEPQCASCHDKTDPLGFALENYDAIGRWRDLDSGQPIDASGELRDGTVFAGPAEMKRMLLDRRSEFRETFVKNLLTYALGRGITGDDECLVRHITEVAAAHDDRFGDIVVAIVTGDAFRKRRNPEY